MSENKKDVEMKDSTKDKKDVEEEKKEEPTDPFFGKLSIFI